jgi:Na+/proline symporter
MSCGAIVAAPALVFSAIFGWDLAWSVVIMGIPTVIYTMIGGVQAVTWVDVKQMVLIVAALVVVVAVLLVQLPLRPDEALQVAGATGRLRVFDFSFDVNQTYTFWSGLIGGTFLAMSYFGTDQSQAQRYLTAKSVDEARRSLLMSAYWKIPLQGLVLLFGVLVFVFYVFRPHPALFNPAHQQAVERAAPETYQEIQTRYAAALQEREAAAQAVAASRDGVARDALRARQRDVTAVRGEALALAERVTGESAEDVNYIIPWFVLHELPIGLAGIFIAAVMAAAMSSVAAELNSLSTATVIDFYRRWVKPEGSDAHYLLVSKAATGLWGIFACVVATFAATLGSLIEVVNRFGSFFYGSILGVFLLAMIPRARGVGAFFGLLAGMGVVATVTFAAPSVSFLWHNVIGAVTVVAVGVLLSVSVEGRLQKSV